MSTKPTFDECKTALLRLAATLAKSSNGAELRALLLADIGAPYHSFDVLQLTSDLLHFSGVLDDFILDGLDEEGAPL